MCLQVSVCAFVRALHRGVGNCALVCLSEAREDSLAYWEYNSLALFILQPTQTHKEAVKTLAPL